jgi:hypothetical protein
MKGDREAMSNALDINGELRPESKDERLEKEEDVTEDGRPGEEGEEGEGERDPWRGGTSR